MPAEQRRALWLPDRTPAGPARLVERAQPGGGPRRGGIADLDLRAYTPRMYSNLQPLTGISGTLPILDGAQGTLGLWF